MISDTELLELIRSNPKRSFSHLMVHAKLKSSEHFRFLDRALQRLRKKGLIKYDKGWHEVAS